MSEREILKLLQQACDYIRHENRREYQRSMDEAKAAIDAMENNQALKGEWLLVSTLSSPHDLDRRCALYQEAKKLIGGRSRLFFRTTPMFDYYCAFAICNPQPGHTDENGEKLAEAVRLFHDVCGGGRGTDVCYQAQLAHYRGQIDEARRLALHAFDLAEKQGVVALWAAYILASIAKHELDGELWRFSFGYINAIADGQYNSDRGCSEQAQGLSCMLDLSIGFLHSVPEWIRNGDFGIIPATWGYELVEDKILHGMTIVALVTWMEYESYCRHPVKALNIADTIQKVYGLGNVELDAYLDFLRAGCYNNMGDTTRMKEVLTRAIKTILPDGLWLIAAEFEPAYGELLYEVAAQVDEDAPTRIKEIGNGYWEKLAKLRNGLDWSTTAVRLTNREQEIAELLGQGKTNAEIAEKLFISERTVKTHLAHIYGKFNVQRRKKLVEAMADTAPIRLAEWTKS